MPQTPGLKVSLKRGRHATYKGTDSQMFRGRYGSARDCGLFRVCPRSGRDDPAILVVLQPVRTFVAQQGAADFSGIVAQADAHRLETFRMLVAAEAVGEECGHAIGDGLYVGARIEF